MSKGRYLEYGCAFRITEASKPATLDWVSYSLVKPAKAMPQTYSRLSLGQENDGGQNADLGGRGEISQLEGNILFNLLLSFFRPRQATEYEGAEPVTEEAAAAAVALRQAVRAERLVPYPKESLYRLYSRAGRPYLPRSEGDQQPQSLPRDCPCLAFSSSPLAKTMSHLLL